ncbi:MAG: ATP synthase F1 subunit delta [Cyanobacteria bacterium SIG32]|nr:ATP synthase F1 subunit delta [Cyanobacteria bacterium SIG32]
MIISQTAKTYAKGLVLTTQNGATSCDAILEELNNVKNIIKSSDDLNGVLNSPAVTTEQKLLIIQDIFQNKVSENTFNFLKLLAEKNRFNEFAQIIEAFKQELDIINGIQRVQVVSAIELTEEYKQKIITKLSEKLNKTIITDWQIDDSIIAGLVIKINDDIIDTSIKNKLENLSKIKGNL